MRAKKLISYVLSLGLCAGTMSAAAVSAANGSDPAAVTVSSATGEKTAASNDAGRSNTDTVVNSPSVITIKLGDLNGDSFIDATDASAILAEYALLSGGKPSGLTATQTLAADVNKDGLVDAVDASNVLSYYAYLSTSGTLSLANYLTQGQTGQTTTTALTGTVTTTTAAATTTKAVPVTSTLTALPTSTTTAASTTSGTASTVTSTAAVTASSVTSVSATVTASTTAAPATSTTTAAPRTATTTAATTTTTKAASTATTTTAVSTTTAMAASAVTSVFSTIPPVTTTSVHDDPNKVQKIHLADSEFNLTVEGRASTIVTVFPVSAKDKSVIWRSSDESVATVDALGNITGLSEGKCIITVSSKANPEAFADIKVNVIDSSRVREIILSKYSMTIDVGSKDISYVTMNPSTAADKSEIWTSSDESVATVDKWGNVRGISEGNCTVTVHSRSNPSVKADISVAVKDPNRVNAIKLSTDELTIPIGQLDISYVTMLPENATNKEEVWVCSDDSIATVDQNGWIKGRSEGHCAVTVYSKANPEVYASIKVHITDPRKVSKIELSAYELDIKAGKRGISMVTMYPDTADKTEIWSSSDPNVATVDEWGNISGVSAGSCTITVKSASNPEVQADIKVTVSAEETTTSSASAATSVTSTTTAAAVTTTSSQHLVQVQNGVTYIDGILIVNKSYKLPESYDAKGLNPIAADCFRRLSQEAEGMGLKIVCSSGYRSYSDQERIYNNYVAVNGSEITDTFSARPGHSEHQTGLAIDVNSISDAFDGTPECEWLAKNAHRFGFIIRYPKGKESITGFRYEPWHIRYVGTDAATAIYNSGLCLEEYLGIDSYYH